jgi:aminoglycoside N3'-acetyltransferase
LVTSGDIARQVRAIGIREGDMVLLQCVLRAIGPLEPDKATAIIGGMRGAVDTSGTILALAHSRITSRLRADPDTPFNRTTKAITGGSANALIDRPEAERRSHPTNSIVAIGADAKMITRYHDEEGSCFGFVRKNVERDDPMMLIGCTESGPGSPSTSPNSNSE